MTFVAPPFSDTLFEHLLALNNAHAEELSFKTADQFKSLIASAHVVLAEPDGLALLIAFRDDSNYDNPNFRWLKENFARFLYIDRVVVSGAARGRGLARTLYDTLEEQCLREQRERLVCEINLDPPNPASDGFHLKLGFQPVGSQTLPGGHKTVRYWAKYI